MQISKMQKYLPIEWIESYIFFVSVKILKILEESEFLMLNFIYGKLILFALKQLLQKGS